MRISLMMCHILQRDQRIGMRGWDCSGWIPVADDEVEEFGLRGQKDLWCEGIDEKQKP